MIESILGSVYLIVYMGEWSDPLRHSTLFVNRTIYSFYFGGGVLMGAGLLQLENCLLRWSRDLNATVTLTFIISKRGTTLTTGFWSDIELSPKISLDFLLLSSRPKKP